QQPLGRFIVDFFCEAARLVVGVDGGYHDDPSVAARDAARDALLRAAGLTVLRLPNEQILHDPERGLDRIRQLLRAPRRRDDTRQRASFPTASDESPRQGPPPLLRERGPGGEGKIQVRMPPAQRPRIQGSLGFVSKPSSTSRRKSRAPEALRGMLGACHAPSGSASRSGAVPAAARPGSIRAVRRARPRRRPRP
ncbi:MAG: DUF559 domain-containing protein, partial [Myxococcales bacterium]|nr:DUF559 domain-containing protein [Myxococcales bacterium]